MKKFPYESVSLVMTHLFGINMKFWVYDKETTKWQLKPVLSLFLRILK